MGGSEYKYLSPDGQLPSTVDQSELFNSSIYLQTFPMTTKDAFVIKI